MGSLLSILQHRLLGCKHIMAVVALEARAKSSCEFEGKLFEACDGSLRSQPRAGIRTYDAPGSQLWPGAGDVFTGSEPKLNHCKGICGHCALDCRPVLCGLG